jgi:tungstate transport system substrate-binding protein
MIKKLLLCLAGIAMIIGLVACAVPTPTTPAPSATTPTAPAASTATAPPKPANPELIMASTTSTGDSGLMNVLIPIFQQKTGYTVKPIYVGSGAAMTMGERGEADVLLVHAPDSEVKFMTAGNGVVRKLVMHNDFIIIGPANDPAGIKGLPAAIAALKKIGAGTTVFISRGDNSGTDQLEKKLWKTAGIESKGQTWYQESGQGMGATLTIASEKAAYTITDRATYLATQKNLNLGVLVQGDPVLLNIYHVIEVNPAKSAKINAEGAKAFSAFMVDPSTQEIIGKFGVDKYGQALFFPDAGKKEVDLGSI